MTRGIVARLWRGGGAAVARRWCPVVTGGWMWPMMGKCHSFDCFAWREC